MSNILKTSILLAVTSVAHVAQGGEFQVQPSIAVSEEFTDNVYETKTGRTSDFISRAVPGFVLGYKAPTLSGDLSYLFDYRYYARNSHEVEIAHTLSATAKLTAVKNLLFLDVSDQYQRVSLDVTRDATKDSLFVDQSDQNVATISPYLELHPMERVMVKTGYKYVDTRYFSSAAVDKYSHIAFLNITYELSNRWSLTADYTFTREIADVDNYDQHQTLGGFRYEYADKSFLFAQAGYNSTIYDSGQSLYSIIWNAGFFHSFDTVTCTLNTGVKYDEDPQSNIMQESFVNGTIDKHINRGTLSFSAMYSEYVMPSTDTLQTRKYGATVRGQYEFVTDLNGSLGLTAEKYEQPGVGNYTRVQVESSLSYLLAKQLTVKASYVYTDYSSSDIANYGWYGNRAMIELKKIF